MLFLLVTFGSRGDVHPMLGLGRALAARGHEVTVVSNPVFRAAAEQAGLGFEGVGTEEDYQRTVAHPKLWHAIDGLGVMWRYLLRPALRPTYELLGRYAQGDTSKLRNLLVVASSMAMGARVAQEKWGLPVVNFYTAATMLRSVENPMTLASWQVPKVVPRWVRRALWALLDRFKLEPLVRPALAQLRAEAGLPPMTGGSLFASWIHSPMGGLTLFPDWFAPRPSDWPAQVQGGGFVFYDEVEAVQAEGSHLFSFRAEVPAHASTARPEVSEDWPESVVRQNFPRGESPSIPQGERVEKSAPFPHAVRPEVSKDRSSSIWVEARGATPSVRAEVSKDRSSSLWVEARGTPPPVRAEVSKPLASVATSIAAPVPALPPDLQRFLAAGPAPVVFMPGSAQKGADDFFKAAIAACHRLGLRGVLLGERGGEPLPDFMWAAPYLPFAPLLPQARALVHHGGVGTAAQALRAGVAQLVWPKAFDQFDNAMRLETLGVGLPLLSDGTELADSLADALQRLLSDPTAVTATQKWAHKINETQAQDMDAMCRWLETRL